jgi:ethanolamine ammonia-lyase large subunit
METDFTAVRHHVECALARLAGADKTTTEMRIALELLLEAAVVAAHSRRNLPANVVFFRRPPLR